jgi:hypothetical protein
MDRKHLSKFVVMLVIVSFGLVIFGGVTMAKESKSEKILDQVSKEGFTALQDMRHARVALFDDQIEGAEKYLENAKKNLDAAEKKAPELTVSAKSKTEETPRTDFIPIDAWLVLSEDFIPSPEKKEKINAANEHLKKGETDKAVEILRLADIGVSVTRLLMPLKLTMAHLDGALAMLKDQLLRSQPRPQRRRGWTDPGYGRTVRAGCP